MPTPDLIFIEGMTGAGKSTTAENLESWLRARGTPVRRYHEMDSDNPVRTRGVDAMRANHPQAQPLPGVGADGFALDPSAYRIEQWGDLAREAIATGEVVILESRYIQNSVQPRYLNGAPVAKVHEGFRKIRDQVAFAEPLLIYLRPQDIREHLRRCLDERETKWSTWLVESFSGYAWARSRGTSGEEAVFAFYEDWETVAAELFEAHPGPKLWLRDPQEDWDAALARIHAALPA